VAFTGGWVVSTGAGWILLSRLAASGMPPSAGLPSEAVASDERPGKGDGQPEHEGQDSRRKGPLSHAPRMGQVTHFQAIIRRG
jgi:hypothetical protein